MLTLFIVLASIAAYFTIGHFACGYTVPRGIQRSYDYGGWIDKKKNALEAGRAWRGLTLVFWPITIPMTALLSGTKNVEQYSFWYKDEQAKIAKVKQNELEKNLFALEAEFAQFKKETDKRAKELGIK